MDTVWQAIGWWEVRRPGYNLLVGSAAILSGVTIGIIGMCSQMLFGTEFGIPDPPLFAIIAVILYAIMANVLYTGGWIAEVIVRLAWPQQADQFASISFILGLFFSVLLTLSPAILLGTVTIVAGLIRFFSGAPAHLELS